MFPRLTRGRRDRFEHTFDPTGDRRPEQDRNQCLTCANISTACAPPTRPQPHREHGLWTTTRPQPAEQPRTTPPATQPRRTCDRRPMKRAWPWVLVLAVCVAVGAGVPAWTQARVAARYPVSEADLVAGRESLSGLTVRERAASTGYSREQFGQAWADVDRNGCDTRNDVLARDLVETRTETDDCTVLAGTLDEPYTGSTEAFVRGPDSADVQIDHVVALADAWETGAQDWTARKREAFANDPANLLAVDGPANQDKGASDAATWLPPNKGYRCVYVLRQIRVKAAYGLWVTADEHDALDRELGRCVVARTPVPTEVDSPAHGTAPPGHPRATFKDMTSGDRPDDQGVLAADAGHGRRVQSRRSHAHGRLADVPVADPRRRRARAQRHRAGRLDPRPRARVRAAREDDDVGGDLRRAARRGGVGHDGRHREPAARGVLVRGPTDPRGQRDRRPDRAALDRGVRRRGDPVLRRLARGSRPGAGCRGSPERAPGGGLRPDRGAVAGGGDHGREGDRGDGQREPQGRQRLRGRLLEHQRSPRVPRRGPTGRRRAAAVHRRRDRPVGGRVGVLRRGGRRAAPLPGRPDDPAVRVLRDPRPRHLRLVDTLHADRRQPPPGAAGLGARPEHPDGRPRARRGREAGRAVRRRACRWCSTRSAGR